MDPIIKKLLAPFDPSLVSWRVGSTTQDKTKGQALAYIDARDVMRRLDEAVGPDNWQDEYQYFGETAICYLSLRINGEWIKKGDGAGDTQVEAEKGRISDAFKRAAVKWGIGRYLYDLDSPWVQLDNKRIAKHEFAKLEAILKGVKPTEPKKGIPTRMADDPDIQEDMKGLGYDPKKVYDEVIEELNKCQNSEMLTYWKKMNDASGKTKGLPSDLNKDVKARYLKLQQHFADKGE